ncbi:CACNA1A [Symbiodinium microadriaticum]|nr:CACNA1A [Symbiodinium microadriaticum]
MKQMKQQRAQVESLRGFFEKIQTVEGNVGNQVSLRDLKEALHRDKLSGFLESMGISTQDVWSLFMIIDADRSGLIDLEEFVAGCMQLHGPAKSLHVAKMSHDNKVTRQMLQEVEVAVRQAHGKLDRLLRKPGRDSFSM